MRIWDKIKNRILWIFDRQWDYKYLNNCFRKSRKESINTICIGSSYTAFGINSWKTCINMALPSQDIYYTTELIKKYLDSSSDISNIIIGMGYYSLYSDLSRTKSVDENDRIYDVYFPILQDLHNMPDTIFNETVVRYGRLNKLIRLIINLTFFPGFPKNYFNKVSHTRNRRGIKSWRDSSLKWNELSDDERYKVAHSRVMAHEKQFKYSGSERENRRILCELSKICKDKNINLYTYISPMTNEYLSAMSDYYVCKKKELCAFLEKISDGFIDFNVEEFIFERHDFVDSDHLGDSGANKLSAYIIKVFDI